MKRKNKTAIALDAASQRPLPDQVAAHFRQKILDGDLPAGGHLPSCDSIKGVSHVTVLKAYQRLVREGLVRTTRAKGTVVADQGAKQFYLYLSHFVERGLSSYFDHLLLETALRRARFKGEQPMIHFFNEEIGGVDKADSTMPANVRQAMDCGRIRGVIAVKANHFPGAIELLLSKKIPVVEIGNHESARTHMMSFDVGQMIADGIRRLRAGGAGRIFVLGQCSFAAECLSKTGINPMDDAKIIWHPIGGELNEKAPHEIGLAAARKYCRLVTTTKAPLPPCLVLDDWVALAFVSALRAECGLRKLPHILVLTEEGQLAEALHGCGYYLLDLDSMMDGVVEMIEDERRGELNQPSRRWTGYTFSEDGRLPRP